MERLQRNFPFPLFMTIYSPLEEVIGPLRSPRSRKAPTSLRLLSGFPQSFPWKLTNKETSTVVVLLFPPELLLFRRLCCCDNRQSQEPACVQLSPSARLAPPLIKQRSSPVWQTQGSLSRLHPHSHPSRHSNPRCRLGLLPYL